MKICVARFLESQKIFLINCGSASGLHFFRRCSLTTLVFLMHLYKRVNFVSYDVYPLETRRVLITMPHVCHKRAFFCRLVKRSSIRKMYHQSYFQEIVCYNSLVCYKSFFNSLLQRGDTCGVWVKVNSAEFRVHKMNPVWESIYLLQTCAISFIGLLRAII